MESHSESPTFPREKAVILVMGASGSGKSTFIKHVTGRGNIGIGNGLNPHTYGIWLFNFRFDDREIDLIDTPGCNLRTGSGLFNQIARLLATGTFFSDKLSRILYLHNIRSNLKQSGALQQLSQFTRLLGESNLSTVELATTGWTSEFEEEESIREKKLMARDALWGSIIKKGARVRRLYNTRSSVSEIVDLFWPDLVLGDRREVEEKEKHALDATETKNENSQI